MLNKIQKDWSRKIVLVFLNFMVVSIFLPRAFLSISLILFIIASFFHNKKQQQLRSFFSTPLLWGISLLFFLPFISGLWSDDQETWMDFLRIKAPLFFLPLAFAAPLNLQRKDWETTGMIFSVMVTLGSFWSIWEYAGDMKSISEGYLKAKVIRTPLDDDHIRFSWITTISIAFLSWQFLIKRKTASRLFLLALLLLAGWLTIYLHILAARTGLLCLYFTFLFFAVWVLIRRSRLLISIVSIIFAVGLPIVSFYIFPTFQNRVKYFLYDASHFQKSSYLPGSNDGSRYFSIKAGINILKEHPLSGVGFGDIRKETNSWYEKNVPGMIEKDKLYPSSEWLMYGNGSGWPGVLIFTMVMMIPFTIRHHRKYFLWWILNATAILTFLLDIGLETQYGVFLYAFLVLWWWKWLLSLKGI